MAIRLKWKNPNTAPNVVKIYRSVALIDTAALPAPIAEISDGSTTYLDEFPKYGESFYYVFSVTVNGRELFSGNRLYSCVIDLGPGPKDLLAGDYRLGYFGITPIADLGFNANLYGSSATWTALHKLVRKGKIIYIPGSTIGTSITNLRNQKALSSGITPRNDPFAGAGGEIKEFLGRLYAARIPKLFDDTNTDVNINNYNTVAGPGWASTPVTPLGKSEIIDILRVVRPPAPDWPTPFSINTDSATYNTSNYLGVADFSSATAAHAFSNVNTFNSGSTTRAFNDTIFVHPVIEYKGTV